jgi:hypothetical protein
MGIIIDESIIKCVRGVYGIFIEKDGNRTCEYVGKSEEVQTRAECHKNKIESGTHIEVLVNANKDSKTKIIIAVLEDVPYVFDNYYKDAQRLASAENYWIDKYQGMGQCLYQVPEGKRPSIESWEKLKRLKYGEICI